MRHLKRPHKMAKGGAAKGSIGVEKRSELPLLSPGYDDETSFEESVLGESSIDDADGTPGSAGSAASNSILDTFFTSRSAASSSGVFDGRDDKPKPGTG